MLESYATIAKDGTHEIEIKKSRFICSLFRVTSEEEAKEHIQKIKKEHWKATHHCSAYQIGENHEIQRSNDDGEPSGTAGVPMLEVLKKQDLHDTLAVVTRYFGGTKLGAGGLIRAYSHAVSEGLQSIGIVLRKRQQELFLTIHYPQLGKVEHFIETSPYTIQHIDYTDQVKLTILADQQLVEQCQQDFTQLLNGQVSIERGEFSYHEVPLTQK